MALASIHCLPLLNTATTLPLSVLPNHGEFFDFEKFASAVKSPFTIGIEQSKVCFGEYINYPPVALITCAVHRSPFQVSFHFNELRKRYELRSKCLQINQPKIRLIKF
jgi:hypothetical protein